MSARPRDVLLTGATGLLGSGVLRRLLDGGECGRIHALTRRPSGLAPAVRADDRVAPLRGDLTRPGLAVEPDRLRRLDGRVGVVIHAAADTRFSQTAEEARRTNVEGTLRLLELATGWSPPPRFVFLSTVFVAGRRTGRITEEDPSGEAGWVNEYERSKHRAEGEVRQSGLPWLVCRASTVVCDSPGGRVSQVNAVHRALRVCFHGLAPMLPGDRTTPVDVVPADYVSRAVAELAYRPDMVGRTYQLAAGADAMPLGELFDVTYDFWSRAANGRRPVVRPVLTDMDTWRLFERSVLETAEPRLRRVTRALSHFVPQLAYPKRFATDAADAALGYRPPPVCAYWPRMLGALADGWGVRLSKPGAVEGGGHAARSSPTHRRNATEADGRIP